MRQSLNDAQAKFTSMKQERRDELEISVRVFSDKSYNFGQIGRALQTIKLPGTNDPR